METVLTFEEFVRKEMNTESIKERGKEMTQEEWDDFLKEEKGDMDETKETYVRFTNMHVQAALKAAAELAINLADGPIKHELILTCYDVDKIG